MTKPLIFDSDCLCAFLWVHEEQLLKRLYENNMVIPQLVYNEISEVPHLKNAVDSLLHNGDIQKIKIFPTDEDYCLYREMTLGQRNTVRPIGKGEAAVLVLSKRDNGIVASNNYRDVAYYVKKYQLEQLPTGDILVAAMQKGFITEKKGNIIWSNMIQRRRRLPTATFSEYLNQRG